MDRGFGRKSAGRVVRIRRALRLALDVAAVLLDEVCRPIVRRIVAKVMEPPLAPEVELSADEENVLAVSPDEFESLGDARSAMQPPAPFFRHDVPEKEEPLIGSFEWRRKQQLRR